MKEMLDDNILVMTTSADDAEGQVVFDILSDDGQFIEYANSTITLETDRTIEIIENHMARYHKVWKALS